MKLLKGDSKGVGASTFFLGSIRSVHKNKKSPFLKNLILFSLIDNINLVILGRKKEVKIYDNSGSFRPYR
jgi:hypothetical protein